MNLRTAMALALLAGAGNGYAQGAQEAPSAPDGTKPSDGAITGGSIKRGGGAGTEGATPGIGAETRTSEEAVRRCNEMTGTLREQCLLQEKGAGAGGTRPPGSGPDERKADPRAAPPPQNPR
jgi:hypothetical protein